MKAFSHCTKVSLVALCTRLSPDVLNRSSKGMASPLIGIAGVNSLLFASYATFKRIISPYPPLSLKEIAAAGTMVGAANAILISPGTSHCDRSRAQ